MNIGSEEKKHQKLQGISLIVLSRTNNTYTYFKKKENEQ